MATTLNFTGCNTKKPFDDNRENDCVCMSSVHFFNNKCIFIRQMRIFFSLLFFSCLLSSQLNAQRHSRKSMFSYKYKSVRMSKQKAQVVCPIFENSEYPYHGIGVKVGDPVAITYKYYQSHKFAVAIDVGSAASGLYNKYHRERFDSQVPDDLAIFPTIQYVRHKVNSEYTLEGKLLYQSKAEKLFPGLQSYVGVGWQFRQADITYSYFYELEFRERESGKFDSREVTFGPMLSAGLEYAYFKLPVSAFMEISFYSDLSADPGWTRFQGGVGIRYVF